MVEKTGAPRDTKTWFKVVSRDGEQTTIKKEMTVPDHVAIKAGWTLLEGTTGTAAKKAVRVAGKKGRPKKTETVVQEEQTNTDEQGSTDKDS